MSQNNEGGDSLYGHFIAEHRTLYNTMKQVADQERAKEISEKVYDLMNELNIAERRVVAETAIFAYIDAVEQAEDATEWHLSASVLDLLAIVIFDQYVLTREFGEAIEEAGLTDTPPNGRETHDQD